MALLQHASGFDISSNNHVTGEPIDFRKVKDDGYDFVIVKATQGNYYLNEYLLGDTKNAFDAGLKVGIYHFLEGDATPEEQADWFIENGIELVRRENGDILSIWPVLDYETGGPNVDVRNAFLTRVRDVTHLESLVYMDRSYHSVLGDAGAGTWLAWPGWAPHDGYPGNVVMIQNGAVVINGIPGVETDTDHTNDVRKLYIDPDKEPEAAKRIDPPEPPETKGPDAPVTTVPTVDSTPTDDKGTVNDGVEIGTLYRNNKGYYFKEAGK